MAAAALGRASTALAALALVGLLPADLARAQDAANPATSPSPSTSSTASFTSPVSEVDACNRAQQDLPAGAVVTTMRVRQQMGQSSGYSFRCDVRWSTAAAARPTLMPITFGPVWR